MNPSSSDPPQREKPAGRPVFLQLGDQVGFMPLLEELPHARALGLELVFADWYEAELRQPYRKELVGYPETGVIHGGVVTTLLDNVSGIAATCSLHEFRLLATLDLRIDYMKPAEPEKALNGYAHCYKVTENVAFVRGIAYQGDRSNPVATSSASFMLNERIDLDIDQQVEIMKSLREQGVFGD